MKHKVPTEREARVCACGQHGFIPLTLWFVTFVDPADVPRLRTHKWFAVRKGRYARAYRYVDAKRTIPLSREVAGAPKGMVVDHINRDTLDNRRENLRVCTHTENTRNQHTPNRKGFKGVYPDGRKWRARIYADGSRHHLGLFCCAEEAAQAYDAAARDLHGDFACTNKALGLL